MTNYNLKCPTCGFEVCSGEEPTDFCSQEWDDWSENWNESVEDFKYHNCI